MIVSLSALMAVGPGEWSTIYMYKFITGSYNAAACTGTRWDCTSPDWRAHWTSVPETYCWDDYLTAINSIPANVTVADPATVAEAWNPDANAPAATVNSGPVPTEGTVETSATFDFSPSLSVSQR